MIGRCHDHRRREPRERRHEFGSAEAHRRRHAGLCRPRHLQRHQHAGGATGTDRARGTLRLARPRDPGADGGRHDRAPLLHDQADRLYGLDDPVRGGELHPRRPRGEVHPGLCRCEGPVRGRQPRRSHPSDDDRRRDGPYERPHLPLPRRAAALGDVRQRRDPERRRVAGRCHRRSRALPIGLPPRHALEVQLWKRRRRAAGRGHRRTAAAAGADRATVRAFGHAGHRLRGGGGQARQVGRHVWPPGSHQRRSDGTGLSRALGSRRQRQARCLRQLSGRQVRHVSAWRARALWHDRRLLSASPRCSATGERSTDSA